MDKKALLEYALFARKELETQIAISLNKIGIYDDHVSYAQIVGDRTIIEGISESFDKRVFSLRKRIIDECLKDQKFSALVEEFAYTWFNRIIAIRFMEVHDYFSHGFRVVTSRDGSYEPEILKNLSFVLEELNLNGEVIESLKEQNKIEELYRYILIKQCNALNPIFPDLFDKQESYLEFLLPNNLLGQDSVIRKINIIPEKDFLNDVEVVGWLYQFYNSVKKDEVFASKETITKDTLPAVTQLFTPDWIVRYMAENSVGRLWLESYPYSTIKNELKYYVDDADQDEEVKREIDVIKYKNVNPEEIKVIEPCCGSGHILVYVFDLIYKMYLEKGYNSKEIPGLILKKNLYGLDVDKRAAQLANFSLVMKARSIDNRFFNEGRFVSPNVFEIKDSQCLLSSNYEISMQTLHFSKKAIEQAKKLQELFANAKVIGSLLRVGNDGYSLLSSEIEKCLEKETPSIFEQDFYHYGINNLKQLIKLDEVLSSKYDVMITNPPYCNTGNLDNKSKEYAIKYYPNSKTDMYAMFMESNFLKKGGFLSMINMQAWMFLTSFSKFRENFLKQHNLINMLHLGPRAFDAINGEIVQTTAFIFRNSYIENYPSIFYRLISFYGEEAKRSKFLSRENNLIYIKKISELANIPESPISYWVPEQVLRAYRNLKLLGEVIPVKKGADTGDNDKYLRYWFEIYLNDFNLYNDKDFKWVLYNKGGEYRKWYGNNYYVVWWKNDGYDLKHSKANLRSPQLYFRDSITWTTVGNCTYRYCPFKSIFDSSGSSMFPKTIEDSFYYLGMMNSKPLDYFLKVKNSTLSNGAGTIAMLPVFFDSANRHKIIELSRQNYELAKKDWDNSEISFEFKKHPIFNGLNKLEDAYNRYKEEAIEDFNKMKFNEVELNKIFINDFELNDVLDSDVDIKNITYKIETKKQIAISLVSYLVGCLCGRYSLKYPGLFSGIDQHYNDLIDEHVVDEFLLNIYKFVGIEDGLTFQICRLIKNIFGETYYRDNLNFLAEALGRRTEEGPEETINRYLNEEFYNDHLRTYQKRPIYWMFSSGKHGAFKCLMYMHKYNKNTLALINSKYFLPRTALYKAEGERIEEKLKSETDNKKRRELEKYLQEIDACQQELLEYGQILDHMANQYVDIDLDDGVKTNYCKFQGISLEVNGATIKKDLLVEFGLNSKKKKGAE